MKRYLISIILCSVCLANPHAARSEDAGAAIAGDPEVQQTVNNFKSAVSERLNSIAEFIKLQNECNSLKRVEHTKGALAAC